MYTTHLRDELIIGSFDKGRSSSLHQTNAGINVQNKIIDLKYESYDGDFDIFILHGYQISETTRSGQFIFDKKIKCKTFIIDLMGEYKIPTDFREYEKAFNPYIEYEDIKVIGVYEDIDTIRYKKWKFFKEKCSWQFFINPQNNTFHNWLTNPALVLCGTKWISSVKENLFQCLNHQMREHRIHLVNQILKKDLKCNFILSSREAQDGNIKVPNISVDDVVEVGYSDGNEKRFGLQTQFSNNCYIDVVTETMCDHKFITEKSIKPFYSLQFPIIFGYKGIIKYFEDLGFDMFRDIINHNYDEIDNIEEKAKCISDELYRLSLIEDFHSIYIDSKQRLLSNQHLLNYYNFGSNRHEKLAKFIFGKSFSSIKSDENFNILYL